MPKVLAPRRVHVAEGARPAGNQRGITLRQRLHRSVFLMVFIIFACGLINFIGSRMLVNNFRRSAVSVEREATNSAELRSAIVAHAVIIASETSADQQLQLAIMENQVRTGFIEVVRDEPSPEARAGLAVAEHEWQLLDASGGPGVSLVDRGAAVSQHTPAILAAMDEAGSISRRSVRDDLATSARVERTGFVIFGLLDLLAIVLALRVARRMSSQILRPLEMLRDSANQLATGHLDHRVVLDRTDEIGDLAHSFNAMADAIAGSQRTLTLEANSDSLTGLANRAAFTIRLQEVISRPDRRIGDQAVLFADLDDFKNVNDTLGHAAGDELLRVVASRLAAEVRPGDLVARLGGDEFAILLDGLSDVSVASSISERIVLAVAERIEIGTEGVRVGTSVGVAIRRLDSTPSDLMREADVAMYAAKAKGKNRVAYYDAGLEEAALESQQLRADIAGAVAADEFVIEYQPVMDLKTGSMLGIEALVRWQHPTRGLLPPSMFIGLAEDSGAIVGLGAWVLDSAARQVRAWQDRFSLPHLWVSVNVSMLQLDSPDYADGVAAVLQSVDLDPSSLVLEVTESVLGDPRGGAPEALLRMRRLGTRIALDDFGTGYASISYLRRLPLDIIKIDQSFTSDSRSTDGNTLLEAIVAMAQHLGLEVIPEGIESSEQLTRLREMGCNMGQGFLLSRPSPPETIEALLAWPLPDLRLFPDAVDLSTSR